MRHKSGRADRQCAPRIGRHGCARSSTAAPTGQAETLRCTCSRSWPGSWTVRKAKICIGRAPPYSTLRPLGFLLRGFRPPAPGLVPKSRRAGGREPFTQAESTRPLFLAGVAPPRRDDLTLWLFTGTVKSFDDYAGRSSSAIAAIGIAGNDEVCRGSMPIHVRRPRGRLVPRVGVRRLADRAGAFDIMPEGDRCAPIASIASEPEKRL